MGWRFSPPYYGPFRIVRHGNLIRYFNTVRIYTTYQIHFLKQMSIAVTCPAEKVIFYRLFPRNDAFCMHGCWYTDRCTAHITTILYNYSLIDLRPLLAPFTEERSLKLPYHLWWVMYNCSPMGIQLYLHLWPFTCAHAPHATMCNVLMNHPLISHSNHKCHYSFTVMSDNQLSSDYRTAPVPLRTSWPSCSLGPWYCYSR